MGVRKIEGISRFNLIKNQSSPIITGEEVEWPQLVTLLQLALAGDWSLSTDGSNIYPNKKAVAVLGAED